MLHKLCIRTEERVGRVIDAPRPHAGNRAGPLNVFASNAINADLEVQVDEANLLMEFLVRNVLGNWKVNNAAHDAHRAGLADIALLRKT